jgi:hypothetical protein
LSKGKQSKEKFLWEKGGEMYGGSFYGVIFWTRKSTCQKQRICQFERKIFTWELWCEYITEDMPADENIRYCWELGTDPCMEAFHGLCRGIFCGRWKTMA